MGRVGSRVTATLAALAVIALCTVVITGLFAKRSVVTFPLPDGGPWVDCDRHPTDCDSGVTKAGGTLVVAEEQPITGWFVADAASNTYDQTQIMSGLIPRPFIVRPNSSVVLNTDLMTSATLVSQNPQEVEYKIKQDAVWNDGTPITAADFRFTWEFQDGKDCHSNDCPVFDTAGYDTISNITSADNGKTVDVTWRVTFTDWRSLFALWPSKPAATYAGGDLYGPGGLARAYQGFLKEAKPAWSGGPYMIQNYQQGVSTTLVPNPRWYGAVHPSLQKIVYKVIDASEETNALRTGEVNVVTDAQPSADLFAALSALPGVYTNLSAGPTWEHIDLNLRNRFLSDRLLRQAIFTAINRRDIIAETVLPFFPTAVPLNNHNYMPGSYGYTDNVTATGQGTGNTALARQILTSAGYTNVAPGQRLTDPRGSPVATLRFSFTQTDPLSSTTATLVRASLAQLGIAVSLTPAADMSVLRTGDYDMITFASVSSPFLSGNKDLWATNGDGNYGHYSNPQVDRDLARALGDFDPAQQAADFNAADVLMTQDAYVLPLYQRPTLLAVSHQFVNIRNNPTQAGPAYNMDEWGLRVTA